MIRQGPSRDIGNRPIHRSAGSDRPRSSWARLPRRAFRTPQIQGMGGRVSRFSKDKPITLTGSRAQGDPPPQPPARSSGHLSGGGPVAVEALMSHRTACTLGLRGREGGRGGRAAPAPGTVALASPSPSPAAATAKALEPLAARRCRWRRATRRRDRAGARGVVWARAPPPGPS